MGSPAASKAKGRNKENWCVTWLHQWWPSAERRRLQGNKDKGDVAGTPYVIEIKGEERLAIPSYLRELSVEMENAGVDVGFVMVKQNHKPPFFVLTEDTMRHFLNGLYG